MLIRKLLVAVLLFLTAAASAQTPASITVRDAAFHSGSLGREMKYRVLLPAGYASTSSRYPVLYLLHGLTGSYIDWESRTHLDDYAAPLQLIVVMPDGDDSWYANSVVKPQDKFEDYIAKDLIPEVDKTYRTIAAPHARAIAGLSMGGYGALKFALKYPDLFVFAGSFSGAVVIPHDPGFKIPFGSGKYDQQVLEIFGPAGSPNRSSNDVFVLAAKAEPGYLPYLWLTCGTADGLLSSNREFVGLLQQRKIPYFYEEAPGEHSWAYWDQTLPGMLRVLSKHMEIRVGHRFAAPVARPELTPGRAAPPQ